MPLAPHNASPPPAFHAFSGIGANRFDMFPTDNGAVTDHAVAAEDAARLDQLITYCEGIVMRWHPGFAPDYNLSVSMRAARRFFSIKQHAGGTCAIEGFDLSGLATDENLVLTFPAFVGRSAVTSIVDIDIDGIGERGRGYRAEAIPSRAPVSALIFPSTMGSVGRGVLNSIMPRHVFLSSHTVSLDVTGLASTVAYLSPASMESRTVALDDFMVSSDYSAPRVKSTGIDFTVELGNPSYRSFAGGLYSANLKHAIVLAMPYAPIINLPYGVEHIDRTAYAYGNASSLTIRVPDTLLDAAFNPSESCLWMCSEHAPFHRFAVERGWMVSTEHLKTSGAIDYNVLADGTARIVRYRGHARTLELPTLVGGVPVTQIGGNALPKNVVSLTVPVGVSTIAGSVACARLEHLELPKGLKNIGPGSFVQAHFKEPVVIPASCTSIGNPCFGTGLVTFEAVGATVLIDPPFASICFCQGMPPFDFERYDRQLLECPDRTLKLRAALVRLASPWAMTERTRERLGMTLTHGTERVVASLERSGNLEVLELLLAARSFSEAELALITDRLSAAGQTECVIELIDYRHRTFGSTSRVISRFTL